MYKQQSNYILADDIFRGGKSIVDIIQTEPPKTKKIAYLHKSADPETKSAVSIPADNPIKIVDFQGQFIKVESTNEKGGKIIGWIQVADTNVNYNEFLADRLGGNMKDYLSELDQIISSFESEALKKYKSINPWVEGFNAIPGDQRTRYQERTEPLFVDRQAQELQAKRKLSKQFMDDLIKIYDFNKIFDPAKMQDDQNLDEKDRKFADARDKKVQFDVGYAPNYSKDEDADDYLNMGEEMTATMEVLYEPETKGKPIVSKVTLNYPLTYFINNLKHRLHSSEYFGTPTPEQVTNKIGLMAIMVAHEYIHTAQNTQLNFQDIAKLPNLPDTKEIERRKTMREILAHHHSIFPNKIYEDPSADPVFTGTDFVRGKTAIFDQQSDWIQAFLLWMAFDYLKRYEATAPPASLSEKYKFKELKADFETLRKDLSDRLKINFNLGKEAFKTHLTELAKVSNGVFVLPDENLSKEDLEIIEKKAEEEKKVEEEKKAKEVLKEVKTDK